MRVVIVDDHDIVRLGLRTLVHAEDGVEVVGEAGTVEEAVSTCARLRPDLVLMDVRLPDGSGIDACRAIRSDSPATQVLVLTSYADTDLVVEAIEAGATGYVLKQVDTTELLRAIRNLRDGEAVLDPKVTREVLDRLRATEHDRRASAFKDLTRREIDVLAQVAQGRSNPQIAERLMLSEKTVRNHVSSILRKLGLSNRIEAATFAVRHGIGDLSRDDLA